jgi:hypothetical protein
VKGEDAVTRGRSECGGLDCGPASSGAELGGRVTRYRRRARGGTTHLRARKRRAGVIGREGRVRPRRRCGSGLEPTVRCANCPIEGKAGRREARPTRYIRVTVCRVGLDYYRVSWSSIRINPHETTSSREGPRDVLTGAAEGPPLADSRGRARRGGISYLQTNYARSQIGKQDRSRDIELDWTPAGTLGTLETLRIRPALAVRSSMSHISQPSRSVKEGMV